MQNSSNSYSFIENEADIVKLAKELAKVKVAGVDMEADSMYHFAEKICLLQIYYADTNVLIDPLAVKANGGNLDALKPFFANPKINKIFHGADYDMRSLYRDFKIETHGLFDTEIASRFLGYNESGLATGLTREFGLEIDKRFQKKDWSMRPLPNNMLAYAAADTLYLVKFADILKERLTAKGRLEWVREESELLSHVRPQNKTEEHLFMSVKGAGKLHGNQLTVLEKLLERRQYYAKKKDRAPFMIVGNNALLQLTAEQPNTLKALKEKQIFTDKLLEMYGKDMVAAIKAALEVPKDEWLKYPVTRATRMTEKEIQLAEKLKPVRDKFAADLELNPSLVLTKAQMNLIAHNKPKTIDEFSNLEGIRKWQTNLLAKEIVETIRVFN